ncbi:MAG TPA: phosphatase PAP2 family protein [Thermomicrobiales bacterium]|nr:phosphatase PAP2 family protein [Thermomicrobiales bacterium]
MSASRRPLPSPSICLAIATITLLIGLVTGIFAAGSSVLPGDVRIATTIQRASGPLVEVLVRIGNRAGSTLMAEIAIAVAILVAAILRARTDVVYLTTLLILRLAAIPLKGVFVSPRPTEDLVTLNGMFDGYGFPSGHSLTAATLCLGMAVLAWRHIPSRRLAIASVIALVGLMLLVGFARVWVGAHWPSDVVGGFAFGILIVAIGVLVMEWTEEKRDAFL